MKESSNSTKEIRFSIWRQKYNSTPQGKIQKHFQEATNSKISRRFPEGKLKVAQQEILYRETA